MTVQIYAHRGSSAAFAEHTRAAYVQALADGADGVECDLHLTADGGLVLLHDDTVDRTSNGTGHVAELTLAQLRELDFSSWKGVPIPPGSGTPAQQLLTLPELLEILGGAGRPVGLAIEFKYGAAFDPQLVDATLETLRGRGWSPEHSTAGKVLVSFMSFHPGAVKYLAGRVPAEHLCQLLQRTMAEGERLLDDGVAHLVGPGVGYLRANPGNAAKWIAAGRMLRVWTVDTAGDLEGALAAGATQVTTNRPREIREILGAAAC
ncbi:glycerophosphodiester phosphodiesterase family protein [Arthrobacter sp. LAPM80]|uniref:glycerophosphodiester phosphodiesterase n=1 Tax=Arthrobacter sp. LAPM80 TaxID=3141788 RepID=UPI00398B7DA7